MLRWSDWMESRRRLRSIDRGAGFRFLAVLLTLCIPAPLLFLVNEKFGAIAMAVFSGLFALYFVLLLLRRLQCTLLDYCLITVMLGNLEAFTLTLRGIRQDPVNLLSIAFIIAGWVAYGAVKGITHARLLQATSLKRAGLIALGWFSVSGPALALIGVVLLLNQNNVYFRRVVGPAIGFIGVSVFAAGVLAVLADILVSRKARRLAWQTIEEATAQSPAKITSAA